MLPRNRLPKDTQAGFDQLCENRYVFLGSSTNAKIYEKCDIFEGKEVLFTESLGILVKKGFPFHSIMTKQ